MDANPFTTGTCRICGERFERKPVGRTKLYCGRTCAQRAYRKRNLARVKRADAVSRRKVSYMMMFRPIRPLPDGRQLYARSVFPQGKTTWLHPYPPSFSWSLFLGRLRNFLRQSHIASVVVVYTDGWEPPAH